MDSYEDAVSEPRSGSDPQLADDALWRSVDGVIERSPTFVDLRAHRLHLLAAQRFRALGQPVPEDFAADERLAAAVTLAAEITLERARAAYDGTLVLMKGLEVAGRYPSPTLRPFRDLDVIVDRPEQAQRALIAAGFMAVGDGRPCATRIDTTSARSDCPGYRSCWSCIGVRSGSRGRLRRLRPSCFRTLSTP